MSRIDLTPIARLARLHLDRDEIRFFETQVSQILSFMEKLNEVKGLDGVPPTSHPLALTDVFREDRVVPSPAVEEFLKRSPQSKGRFFQVPKIIDVAPSGDPKPSGEAR